ncbi:blr0019 [Bradyrhizobium diazoefficiens USDA 110]|uniref:Blr0019 protein n=2 Tax=Bradyrhizobium TaxID=374 RepID=Q89YD5_BRADU|nr:hypothetical protein RN69_00090 [Bradyrhizobium japonicum]AND93142.1 hypothetical protein AAV28_39355 [Bradyrhizobium diazoefficiens USDA 110]APO48579.1 hypothetical protein BD122_00085 [Bradyrhizobium diazoefficiens]AWL93309.1 hypothetical protein CIT37_14720 [Bradyrhizobium ottawaense]NLS75371.1 hypothetical protein [Bradyrhizobium brasilense]NWL44149.1 hypothetical protein [Bradyrhizobium elkanii]QHP74041.1 hypothetical protein EI171_01010 [Bradyrhizobium sp. LCT2]QOZ14359.1 hypothetic
MGELQPSWDVKQHAPCSMRSAFSYDRCRYCRSGWQQPCALHDNILRNAVQRGLADGPNLTRLNANGRSKRLPLLGVKSRNSVEELARTSTTKNQWGRETMQSRGLATGI